MGFSFQEGPKGCGESESLPVTEKQTLTGLLGCYSVNENQKSRELFSNRLGGWRHALAVLKS